MLLLFMLLTVREVKIQFALDVNLCKLIYPLGIHFVSSSLYSVVFVVYSG